jgi:hypothetical protein
MATPFALAQSRWQRLSLAETVASDTDNVVEVMLCAGGDRPKTALRRWWPPSMAALQGTVEAEGDRRDRATAPIEDIRCEKIRGCSYSGLRSMYAMPGERPWSTASLPT